VFLSSRCRLSFFAVLNATSTEPPECAAHEHQAGRVGGGFLDVMITRTPFVIGRHAQRGDDDAQCWRLLDRRSASAPADLPSVSVTVAPNTRDCMREAWKRVSLL
jgi:hypothetical protein